MISLILALVHCYLQAFGCTGFIQNKEMFGIALFIEILIESVAYIPVMNYFDRN